MVDGGGWTERKQDESQSSGLRAEDIPAWLTPSIRLPSIAVGLQS